MISKVYAFFHKKTISLLFNDTFFCKCPVLIYLHAREDVVLSYVFDPEVERL